MKLIKEEQETICRTDGVEGAWIVYTSQPHILKRLLSSQYEVLKLNSDKDGPYAGEFRLPMDRVAVKRPLSARASMTTAQKEAMAEGRRLKAAKEKAHPMLTVTHGLLSAD